MYETSEGVRKGPVEAAKWLRKVAENGSIHDKQRAALAFLHGGNVPKNEVEAAYWNSTIRTAAEQGDPDAQCAIGQKYRSGQGVSKDLAEAVKWWRMAAERGEWNSHSAFYCNAPFSECGAPRAEPIQARFAVANRKQSADGRLLPRWKQALQRRYS